MLETVYTQTMYCAFLQCACCLVIVGTGSECNTFIIVLCTKLVLLFVVHVVTQSAYNMSVYTH